MSDEDTFETELAPGLVETFDTDEETATEAASKAAAFREEYGETLTVDEFLQLVEDAPYDAFENRFDAAIGELAADNDDCTDSREYRLAGFGMKGADPSIGA